MSDGTIFAPEGSGIRPFADTIGWLWRVPVTDSPSGRSVGIGTIEDGVELEALVASRQLAGAAVFGSRPGPDQGRVPGRQRLAGTARFGPGLATQGDFTVLHGPGRAVAESSFGAHALRDGSWLTLGFDPVASWGTLQHFWALRPLADFLAELLQRPMAMLPPLGMVRYDDVPGTAEQQLKGETKSDAHVRRRLRRILGAYRRAGAVINVAVACRALDGDREVPLESIWPGSLEMLREGIAEGYVEQVCHGYLHLDRDRSGPDEIEPREFARLDRPEAHRRIEAALEWGTSILGARPRTFIAPNWGYSSGSLEALGEIGLPAWLPFRFGPLVDGPNARETLVSTVNGIHDLDYAPLAALAAAGLPPYVTIHGGLMDARFDGLRGLRHAGALARLALRRDLVRLPGVPGIRWVGSGELMERLRAHDRVEVAGAEIRSPDGVEVSAHGAPVAAP
ncbi:MAG: hypothetical protein FJW90_01820 [Actinobacteria bacterium]|nr:hypothetical protein [Actinomycetota bacterium]